MSDKPVAEVAVDGALVRRLVVTQARDIPDAASLSLAHVDEGWDCSVWRLGDTLAVRLPRRAIAAPLVANEQRYLPPIAARLRAVGVDAPAPVFAGWPDDTFPWPWSIVPWFDGDVGLAVPRARRAGWASALAEALGALHTPATAPYPHNSFRGVALLDRADAVAQRLDAQRRARVVPASMLDRLAQLWADGIAAPPWAGPPTWIHGDLHPGNIIARGDQLLALIDFGDLTAGDPAYDLAIAWVAFDARGRHVFRGAMSSRYDDSAWARAHAVAAAITLMLLEHSDDNPAYAALGLECLIEVTS